MRFSVGSLTKKGSVSSHLWKQRQARDPFVAARDEQGFVARSAFKLREIESKFPGTLRRGGAVLDLGAAPGSWTQMAVTSGCRVVACDLLPHQLSSSVAGQVQWLQGDMNSEEILARIRELGPYVAVLSDAAPSYSGQSSLDHIRLIALAQRASKMADELLVKGGNFVAKISRGGEEKRFVESLAPKYEKVKFFKPQSSRQDSSEIYCVACNKR